MFNPQDPNSIISYAKDLKLKTLRLACAKEIEEHHYKGKGNFGQLVEKFYFGYEPNSKAEADFPEANIELKSSPLKLLKNGEYRSKERLVLNIINYLEVHDEEFKKSSFWKKNAQLLLVFYLHIKEYNLLDYPIKLVDLWQYPEEDLRIIKEDWEIINAKIRAGKADELSEGDTFYLGACTKGTTASKSLREQPFSKTKAKQRAYSLKQGYVNHIIANISNGEKGVFGKILKTPELKSKKRLLESVVHSMFQPFYGKSAQEIEQKFNLELNSKAKSYFANLTNAILGLELGQKIEEFEKAEIQVKTIRLKENNLPKEDISFPTFKYQELITTEWEESDFKAILERKFFFVFYQMDRKTLILKSVKFWNMPHQDIKEAKKVWEATVETVRKGQIVKEVCANGQRKSFFPKKKENRVSHVRPHARDANDTYILPVQDQLTKTGEYTKHCFWLNASYVKDEIYLK